MALDVQVELSRVLANVDSYVKELGMDGVEVVKTQTRLLTKQLVDHAMPPDSKEQGRVAISQDLRRLFYPVDTRKWAVIMNHDSVLKIVPRRSIGKRGKRKGIFAGDGQSGELPIMPFSAMKTWHYGHMNSRGRTSGRRFPTIVGQKFGSLTEMAFVKASDLRKYRRSVVARIGKAKAGFIPAYAAVDGGSLHSWVDRHAGTAEGEARDIHLGASDPDPRITIVNFARGAKGIRPAVLARTLQIRANAMGTHIKKLLSLRAKEASLA